MWPYTDEENDLISGTKVIQAKETALDVVKSVLFIVGMLGIIAGVMFLNALHYIS